jgi:hypothetical protein
MTSSEHQEENYQPGVQTPMPMMGAAHDPEFLKYLLETQDPITELINELEGKETILEGDRLIIRQLRPPIVNASLRNKIASVLKTYNTKGMITTNLKESDIMLIVRDCAQEIIDALELCKTYSSFDWQNDPVFLGNYPSHMESSQQQILLMIEHTVIATLKRSEGGNTLDKITGMHTSQEVRQTQPTKQKALLGGFFK